MRFLSGQLLLPGTEKFPLPQPTDCRGGPRCTEVFCGSQCMQEAWDSWHCLLCTGEGTKARDLASLQEFFHHADETNDIFVLAAKVLASIILSAQGLASHARGLTAEGVRVQNSSGEAQPGGFYF